MSLYIRAAIVAALVFLYIFFGYLYWSAKPIGGEDRAFILFKEKEYRLADAFVEELEKFSSAPNYPLYHAYILRAKNQMILSDLSLDRALKICKLEKNKKLLPEIYYNIALNAYLENDAAKLRAAIDKMREGVKRADSEWVSFFVGLEMHMKGNDLEAPQAWSGHPKLHYPSSWMALAFETYFPSNWFGLRGAKAEIETGNFEAARKALEELAKQEDSKQSAEAKFLLGLLHLKHGFTLSSQEAKAHYDVSLGYFEQVTESLQFFQHDLEKLLSLLEDQLVNNSKNSSWDDFSTHLLLFQKLATENQLKAFAAKLLTEFGNAPALTSIVRILNDDSFKATRLSFSDVLDEKLSLSLQNGQFELFEFYWGLQEFLSKNHPKYIDSMNDTIRNLSVKAIEKDDAFLSKTRAMIFFLKKMEQSPKERLQHAIRFVRESERLWYATQDYDKAVNAFKLAYEIPQESERKYIHQMIDETVAVIYQHALNEDKVTQYFPVYALAKTLKLPSVDVLNQDELAHQIADAEYLLSKYRLQDAKIKAKWVLTVDPSNHKAKEILEKCTRG